jgi:hypothetical protein
VGIPKCLRGTREKGRERKEGRKRGREVGSEGERERSDELGNGMLETIEFVQTVSSCQWKGDARDKDGPEHPCNKSVGQC